MKKKVERKLSTAKAKGFEPKSITIGSDRSRRNVAADIERTDKYIHIENGITPWSMKSFGGVSCVGAPEPIGLCQKAYYNFPAFKNVIDLMTEFSINGIYFKGGNKKGRDFFKALLINLNFWSFQDRFYREFYRAGTVPIYRFETALDAEEVRRLTQVYGSEIDLTQDENPKTLPVRYIIMNPAEVWIGGGVSFYQSSYFKVLNPYELDRLRNPETDEDKALLKSLPPKVREQLQKHALDGVLMPLDPQKIRMIFNKKQDYEPLAVPMGYGVLADLNWKEEMKRIDMAVSRTMQQVMLLVTTGAPENEGGFNPDNLRKLEELFASETVSRTLIADWTTKAEWKVPAVADFLDPKKYEQIDKDIRAGLNDILVGGEKFANQSIKVKIFIERLRQGRECFLNEFLIPEVKRISKIMGFKNWPMPYYEDIDLKDEEEWNRFITRLLEIGTLTPEEGFEAFEQGKLPDAESSLEAQRLFKTHKEEGLYQPVLGGPADQKDLAAINNEAQLEKVKMGQSGRPTGTKGIKQKSRKVTPIGGESVITEEKHSLTKLKDNIILSNKLQNEVEKSLLKRFKLKKLSDAQISASKGIVDLIIANEEPSNWMEKYPSYIDNPVDTNQDRINEISELAANHQISHSLASLLFASKCQE